MSLLNAWVRPDRAIVVVDTASGTIVGGHRFEASKVAVVAHAPMLLAAVGISTLAHGIAAQALFCEGMGSFDLILEQMPNMLATAHAAMVKQGRENGVDDRILFHRHVVVCIGWSATRQRIEGKAHQAQPDGTWLSGDLGWCCVPGEALAGRELLDAPPLPELQDLARRQCDYIRETWNTDGVVGTPIVGGRLIVAEMMTGGRTTIEAHPLD